MSIFTKLRQQKAQEQQSKLEQYYRLLMELDIDAPSDADADKLSKFLTTLGKSVKDAEADHARIALYVARQRFIDEHQNADAIAERTSAERAAAYAHRQAENQRLNDLIVSVNGADEEAKSNVEGRNAARRELNQLQQADPVLHRAIVGSK
jgi:hypothetical protein